MSASFASGYRKLGRRSYVVQGADPNTVGACAAALGFHSLLTLVWVV